MPLNWLKLNDSQPVLAGRWQHCEEYIGERVKEYAEMIQSLKPDKIKFTLNDSKRVHCGVIDCCTFLCQEFRQNPSKDNYDPKSHSCGLVSYVLLQIQK